MGPEYVWITPAWYNKGWWEASSTACSADMLQEMVVGSLAIAPSGFFTLDDPEAVTFSGIVSQSKTIMFMGVRVPLFSHVLLFAPDCF